MKTRRTGNAFEDLARGLKTLLVLGLVSWVVAFAALTGLIIVWARS